MENKMYVLCELDSESYLNAKYSFYTSLEDAKRAAVNACIDWDAEANIQRGNGKSLYRLEAQSEDDFYITEVHPVNVGELENHILVWHHAYEGVDFKVIQTGTKTDCENRMCEEINEMVTECDAERYGDNAIDTGNEWEVWDVVEVI